MDDKLITIAQYTDYIEAEMVKQLLDDFGIKSVVTGENAANLYPISAVAAIDLQVLEKDVQRAQEILESREEQKQ